MLTRIRSLTAMERDRGYTLIEVVVAMAIVAFALLALMNILSSSIGHIEVLEKVDTRLSLAQGVLESVRGEIVATGDITSFGEGTSSVLTFSSDPDYRYQVAVGSVTIDGSPKDDLKSVKVWVWNAEEGQSKTISLATIVRISVAP